MNATPVPKTRKVKVKCDKHPPDFVHWVDLGPFQQVGRFFVRTDDPTKPFFASHDTQLLLEVCEDSGAFDTHQQMMDFHASRKGVMRDVNWLVTNKCTATPVLHIHEDGWVSSMWDDYKSALWRYSKDRLDEFNRDDEQVLYATGDPPDAQGRTPCFAAGPCQVNFRREFVGHSAVVDALAKLGKSSRVESTRVPGSSRKAGSKARASALGGGNGPRQSKPKKKRRSRLTEQNRFVPTLRRRGRIHFAASE